MTTGVLNPTLPEAIKTFAVWAKQNGQPSLEHCILRVNCTEQGFEFLVHVHPLQPDWIKRWYLVDEQGVTELSKPGPQPTVEVKVRRPHLSEQARAKLLAFKQSRQPVR